MMICRLKALQFHSLMYHGTDISFKNMSVFISKCNHHDSSFERLGQFVFFNMEKQTPRPHTGNKVCIALNIPLNLNSPCIQKFVQCF
jgi:hypothetical protein